MIALLAAVVTVGLATMIYVALKSHLDAALEELADMRRDERMGL